MADTAFVNHKSGGQGLKAAIRGVSYPGGNLKPLFLENKYEPDWKT